MTNKQINLYEMFLRLVKIMNQHKTVWESNKKIKENYDILVANTDQITAIMSKQNLQSSGITRDKHEVKDELAEMMTSLSKRLMSYASDNDDNALATSVKYSKSDLLKLRETVLIAKCTNICEIANSHVKNLKDYGITPPYLNEFSVLTKEFKEKVSSPREAINKGKSITKNIDELTTVTYAMLKDKLDGKMDQFKDSNKDAYNDYFNSRTIIDRGNNKGKNGDKSNAA